MPASIDEWLDQHWERALAEQTSLADTSRLVTTFVLAIAASLVGNALQASPQRCLTLWASIALGAAFITGLGVFMIDRPKGVDHQRVFETAKEEGWYDDEVLHYIRLLMRDLTQENRKNAALLARASRYQVLLSG